MTRSNKIADSKRKHFGESVSHNRDKELFLASLIKLKPLRQRVGDCQLTIVLFVSNKDVQCSIQVIQ